MDQLKITAGRCTSSIPLKPSTKTILILRPGGDLLVEVKITKAGRGKKPRGASVVTAVYDELPPKEATDGN
jgi:hypothetical protein